MNCCRKGIAADIQIKQRAEHGPRAKESDTKRERRADSEIETESKHYFLPRT